ncbi:sensor histidine kinase [Allokutzneria oryzae]|uniref:Sensor histidine kinase n=1 Tax=Allokutzneria oryzae TaxID=1378989 RepID=A0ABV5ZSD1_9PSEU
MSSAERPFGRPIVLAVALGFGCLIATAAAWVLYATAPAGPVRPLWYWLLVGEKSVEGLGFAAIGVLLVAHVPRMPLAWLFIALGVSDVLYPLFGAALRHPLPFTVGTLVFLAWLTVNVAGVVLFPLLALFTPDGSLPGPRWRWTFPALALIALAQLTALLLTVPTPGGAVSVPGSPGLGIALLRGSIVAFQVVWALCLAATYADWRRRPKGLRRSQIAVVLTIFGLGYVSFLLEMWFTRQSFARAVVTVPDDLLTVLRLLIAVVGLPALGYALTRTRLHQIDRAARVTLIVVTVVGGLVLSYVVVTALLSGVLPGAASLGALVVAAATGLAGFGLRDAVRVVRRRVDRAFYGERAEPYRVLRALPRRLNEGLPPGETPLVVCQTVVSLLRLPAAAIDVDGRRLASVGVPSGRPTALGLVHQGERLGALLVWPRAGQEALDDLDISVLEPVAEQTAAVIATLLIGERLERGVEEERLRLRRDLHDGLGPALAGVTLQLGAVRTMLPPRSEGAVLLAAVTVHMRQILDDFRRVTRNQRPLLLDEHGPRGALLELCRRLSTERTPVTAEIAEDVPDHCADTVFHVAAESLANAVRHAGASAVALRVTVAERSLTVEVRDNGTGIAQPVRFGVGLESMRERTEAAGGAWALDTGSAGTVVRARFPLDRGPVSVTPAPGARR